MLFRSIANGLVDSTSGMIAIETGAIGHNMAVVTACSTGTNSIGEAAEVIRRGDAIAVIAGSTEMPLMEVAHAGFGNMRGLGSPRDGEGIESVSRPFDATRDGWLHYLDNPARGNALIKGDNPDMSDAILAQAWDKLKRYNLLLSGDGAAFGLGSMTDAQWKLFYDTMASEGIYPKGLDYKKAYDLSFARATLQKFR